MKKFEVQAQVTLVLDINVECQAEHEDEAHDKVEAMLGDGGVCWNVKPAKGFVIGDTVESGRDVTIDSTEEID